MREGKAPGLGSAGLLPSAAQRGAGPRGMDPAHDPCRLAEGPADAHPILAVTVPGADDGPGLLDHLQDGSPVDVASHVGVIGPHDPVQRREKQQMGPLGRTSLVNSDRQGTEVSPERT